MKSNESQEQKKMDKKESLDRKTDKDDNEQNKKNSWMNYILEYLTYIDDYFIGSRAAKIAIRYHYIPSEEYRMIGNLFLLLVILTS